MWFQNLFRRLIAIEIINKTISVLLLWQVEVSDLGEISFTVNSCPEENDEWIEFKIELKNIHEQEIIDINIDFTNPCWARNKESRSEKEDGS